MSEIDFGALFILAMFRGALGLALGAALGQGLRELRARKISGIYSLGNAIVFAFLVAFMHVSISQYDAYPLFYWGVFAVTALAATFKTDSVLKTIGIGIVAIFGGGFFFAGMGIIGSSLAHGFSIAGILVGIVFALIGGVVLASLIVPLLKGKSLGD